MDENVIKQIQLPNGELYNLSVTAITIDEIDAICNASLFGASEVEV